MGGMTATIVSSNTPGALVRWLDENGFAFSDADSARFAPYVARDWFFTAMRPDTATVMPNNGWNADVVPVRVTYSATELEIPLPIITINQAAQLRMQFYVLDDAKSEFPGFTTIYANSLTQGEVDAIRAQYPALSDLVAPGRVLTKLRVTTLSDDAASESVHLRRAPDDEEVRQVSMRGEVEGRAADEPERAARGSIPGELGLLAAAALIARPVRRRRARASER